MYDSQTPLDIHCAKLIEWLIQRRHCKRDWGEQLASVRRKIRVALKDMPEHEDIKQVLIDSKLDYFSSKRIVDILKTTESSSKNIFGRYSSQRMKDWQDVVYSYERDNVYIAEIATDLIRQTNYEVPSIRKTIAKLNKEREDAEREKANVLKKAQQFQNEHSKLAQSYGILGNDVENELLEKSKDLSSVIEQILELSKLLKSEMEQYHEAACSTLKQNQIDVLPMLKNVIENGSKIEVKTILESKESRNLFKNNLHELEAFYMQLSVQAEASDRSTNFEIDAIQTRNSSELNDAIAKVRQILDIMRAEKNKILFQMNDSPTFVTNLIEKLTAKLNKVADYTTKSESLVEHIKDLQVQTREAELNLKKNIALAKTLQEKVERSISNMYSGRPINIMGCVICPSHVQSTLKIA